MSQEVASNIANTVTTAPTMLAAPTPSTSVPVASPTPTIPPVPVSAAPVTPAAAPVTPPTLPVDPSALATTTKESLGYFAKAQNYIQSMSTKNYYILLGVLILLLALSIYYIWNKFFPKKQDPRKIRGNPKEKSSDPKVDPRDPREPRDPRDPHDPHFNNRYPYPPPGIHPNDLRYPNYPYPNQNDERYPNEQKIKSDKSNESSHSNDGKLVDPKGKTKTQIFSNGNQYGEVYVGESLDAQQGQQQPLQPQSQQNLPQQNATIPDDIANYEPDGQTAN